MIQKQSSSKPVINLEESSEDDLTPANRKMDVSITPLEKQSAISDVKNLPDNIDEL